MVHKSLEDDLMGRLKVQDRGKWRTKLGQRRTLITKKCRTKHLTVKCSTGKCRTKLTVTFLGAVVKRCGCKSRHGLYGSTSCCISQWPSQWGWANFDPPPQLRNRLTNFDEMRILELSSKDHPPRKISFRSDDVGGLGEYPVCHC